MKNLIIGHGETLTQSVQIDSGSGPKAHPYTFNEVLERVKSDIKSVLHDIDGKPGLQCANGEVVVKLIQHPSYLAKSYYPTQLFKRFDFKDVGSRSVRIKPRKWAIKNPPEEGLASCIYVSGSKNVFEIMLNTLTLEAELLPESIKDLIRTIEHISLFNGSEKVKSIYKAEGGLNLEVVLHAEGADNAIFDAFSRYLDSLDGTADWERAKSVGGLTFLPVRISRGMEVELAEFSHLRVLRSIPELRLLKPEAMRTKFDEMFSLPEFQELETNFKVCIFDGGLGDENLIKPWVNEIIPPDVKRTHPKLLSHGGEVCSAYLFGPFDERTKSFEAPYTYVDLVRVITPDDTGVDLFDVLTRIENVLRERQYKYVNLSLGPRLPIDDDDVHVWTSVIDTLLQDGHCFATVATGNDGNLDGDDSRIQPPSDMVNCFAVGASDVRNGQWKRAEYSCKGPGRSPGIVKPDGVIFGGSENDLFKVYTPMTDSITATQGTSYAAPYVLRVAAGIDAITDFDLSTSAIKALLIHHANPEKHAMYDVGWGRLPSTPEEAIECKEDEAIIIYQGELRPSQHLRISIPLPEDLNCTWVHLKATFCFNANVDPEHPLHYTRSGLVVSFRPNEKKVKEDAKHASTKSFFSLGKLYGTEEELREDAHKWETCISQSQRFKSSTLSSPVFDVKYHAREKGGNPEKMILPLRYSLVLSIRAEGELEIYNKVLQQYQTLKSIKVSNRVRVTT